MYYYSPYQQYQFNDNIHNPAFNQNNSIWQVCRTQCIRLGYQPGTTAWQNCVHDCMGDYNIYKQKSTSLPDQWIMYFYPLVERALKEVEEGINLTHLFQEFILAGVLVGQGFQPSKAIELVEIWEKGESKLLQQSKKMQG